MKHIVLPLFLIVLSLNAFADPSDLHLMMRAANSQQMAKNLTRSREIPRLRALCAAQLQKKYLPEACFEALALQTPAASPEPWLVDNCVHAVGRLHDFHLLRRLAKLPLLPIVCRTEVQKHADDLRYAAETEAPATLFEASAVR